MKISVVAIILAAGLGTRMKSDKPKVLHSLAGQPLIGHVMQKAMKIAGDTVVVVGNQAQLVKDYVNERFTAQFVYQDRQLGTGHAVLCALPAIPRGAEAAVILCGDVPLIREETLRNLTDRHAAEGRDITLLAVQMPDPAGYGRVVFEGEQLCGIVEESDASKEQKMIGIVNTGIYCVNVSVLHSILPRIGNTNAQGEIYLTDMIKIAYEEGMSLGCLVSRSHDEFTGVNTLEDLERVETIYRSLGGY